MWEFINNIFKEMSAGKAKKIGVVVIIIVILILALYPYIDANFLYFNRVEKRIEILEQVSNIDLDKISKNNILEREYNSIIEEIDSQNKNSVSSIVNNQENNNFLGKFIAGGLFWWLISVGVLFSKNKDGSTRKKQIFNNIGAFFLCVIFGGLTAGLSAMIPTIVNPWINYIGFNIIIIVFLVLLLYKKN